jgi:hypothetical protein
MASFSGTGGLLLTPHLTLAVSELVCGRNDAYGLAETAPRDILEGFPPYPECLRGAHGACKAICLEHECRSVFNSR